MTKLFNATAKKSGVIVSPQDTPATVTLTQPRQAKARISAPKIKAVPITGKPAGAMPINIPQTTGLGLYTEQAKEAAALAQQTAAELKDLLENANFSNVVTDVCEQDPCNLVITKQGGSQTSIKLVKSVNGCCADEDGNIVLPYPIKVKVLGNSSI